MSLEDAQCARCGSSVTWEHCPECEDGYEEYDYGDGIVPMIEYRRCDCCDAKGGFWLCLSSPEWCRSHPIPGRESVPRGTVEEFYASNSGGEK